MVVVNKGGAGGTIGDIEVSNARPDGYTIGLTPNNPITAQPHIQKLPYEMDSFRYVCLTYDVPYVLIASTKAPFTTFAEFMAFAKAKNDNLIYASPGPGTQPHLGILAVLSAIKAEGVHVPFTGAGPMAQAMQAGTVMAMAESPAVAKASNLKVLAALSKTRIAALPDVPTMAELGYPAEAFTAGGIVAPAGPPTPRSRGCRRPAPRPSRARATNPPAKSSTPSHATCRKPNSRRCSRPTPYATPRR